MVSKIKFVSIFFSLLIFNSCSSSENTTQLTNRSLEPIIETEKNVQLTHKESIIVQKVILTDIQRYREGCEKNKNYKSALPKRIFLVIDNKNPSNELLKSLNESFKLNAKFTAARNGFAIIQSHLLSGYKDAKGNKGFLMSVSNVYFKNDSTASVSVHQSIAALAGVFKTYILSQKNSSWVITQCSVSAYS